MDLTLKGPYRSEFGGRNYYFCEAPSNDVYLWGYKHVQIPDPIPIIDEVKNYLFESKIWFHHDGGPQRIRILCSFEELLLLQLTFAMDMPDERLQNSL